MQKLRDSIAVYDSLLRGLRDKLSETDRQTVNLGLASIQLSASNSTRAKGTTMIPSLTEQGMVKISQKSSSQRYLGEASDIRFFHDIELAYCHSPEPGRQQGRPEARIDSYEQERAPTQDPGDKSHVLLPDRASADRLVHIYFSTIHIAYPFISEPDFRQTYESFWQSDSLEGFRGPWLSLLLTVFAIGSCYERFAEPGAAHSTQAQTSDQHQRYFDHAVTIARNYASKHTVDHVSTLLAQCFYLLATCQTDRCWTTLGMGVRIAQSIGLHVEEGHRASCEDALAPREMCRRVWYSIFVLDRLLALQLGRPPAVSEEGFYVNLPSKGSDVDLSNQNGQPSVNEKYWIGDYFLAMINFSTIIGRVFDKLYGPKKAADVALILSVIGRLDSEMLQWRSQLPRHLRFDLSHTFEKSMTFKRQRNMLAIKFYNLQALIHRSLLSPARLLESGPSSRPILHSEYGLISLSKRKCILAAQHTARLLHNIEDKKSLVYGFPWWQMISCLICASSILLVAGICVDLNLEGDVFSDIDWEAVDEDAEVCLTVFQALSSNSNAAKIARDMMQRLKKTRMISRVPMQHPTEQVITPGLAPSPQPEELWNRQVLSQHDFRFYLDAFFGTERPG
ncbi:hypothetical protein LTR41_004109 [Exophiala xenobiotica]|nr:hypothetical protein LTR41_004109 [Exophiala xenobiotica]